MARREGWPTEQDCQKRMMVCKAEVASRQQDGQKRAGRPAESSKTSRVGWSAEQNVQQRAGRLAESRMASSERAVRPAE